MNLIDLIQSDKEQAQTAIADLMQSKVFDYLDNYVLETEELDEAVTFNPDVKQKRSTPVKPLSDKEKKQPFNYDQWKSNKKGMKESEELDEAVVPGSVKKDAKGNVITFKSVPDKKSAVVAGSVKKDNKGNVLSFKTEDYEAMDQDEFDAVVENFEQLDEVSKSTLKSYIKKASSGQEEMQDELSSAKTAAKNYGGKFKGLADKLQNKVQKRSSGIAIANNKLTEELLDEMSQDEFDDIVENFEQLDEISKKTLGSYIKKANDRRGDKDVSDHEFDNRSLGVMKAADKLVGRKTFGGLKGLASDAHWAKSKGHFYANREKQTFDTAVDKLVKKK